MEDAELLQRFADVEAWLRRLEDYITNHAEKWGIPGPQGIKGDTGPPPDVGEVAARLVADGELMKALRADAAFVNATKGEKGDRGDPGQRGPVGPQGVGYPNAMG